jgi:uncharacterized protein DUF4395
MSISSKVHFVHQQGFSDVDSPACPARFSALMFQPKVVGVVVAVGLITQAWPIFLALATVLAWNVIVPRWNPFDALYNRVVAGRRGDPPLGPAPAPRRFAQGMAGTFMLGIGLSLLAGNSVLAWILEGFLVVALLALVTGGFCLGSYIFHVIQGRRSFANETLPWAKA